MDGTKRNDHGVPGKAESLWMATAPGTDYGPLKGGAKVDVAVIGGGIAGITTAFMLKKAGRSVAVIEAFRILDGVTGRTTAHISASQSFIYKSLIDNFGEDAARRCASSNMDAISRIEGLVKEHHIDCDFTRVTEHFYAAKEGDVSKMKDEFEAYKRVGLPVSFTGRAPLPFDNYADIEARDQGRFHPLKYLHALSGMIPGDGSFIFENTRALDVSEGEPCRVKTDKGDLLAKDVVVATHFPILNRGLYFARMVPARSYVITAALEDQIPLDNYYSSEEPCHYIRPQPAPEGVLWLIGGEDHTTGEITDTVQRYRKLEQFVNEHFKVNSIEYSWSTQDNYTPDDIPYIGRVTHDSKHVYVATAFNGNGMTYGTISGMVLSDMILGNKNPYEELYNPGREKLTQAGPELLTRNVHVGEMFLGDRLSHHEDVSRVGSGQAAIASVGGHTEAVFRDEGGRLHTVSPVCTHMGCYVRWNNAERTWDCPCHGSRYNYDGVAIHAPTVKDLKEEPEEKTGKKEPMKAVK